MLLTDIVVLLNFLIGALLLFFNGRNLRRITFGILLLLLAGGLYSLSLALTSPDPFWTRLSHGFAFAIASTLLFFAFSLARGYFELGKVFALVVFAFSLLTVSAIFFTDLAVAGLKTVGGKPAPLAGPLYPFFFATGILMVIFALGKILALFRKEEGILRIQMRYITLGLSLFLLPSLVTNFLLPNVFGIFSYRHLPVFFSLFLTITSSYAVVAYRFLGITFLLERGIYLAVISSLTVFFYLLFLLILGRTAVLPTADLEPLLAAVFAAVITSIWVPKLERSFQSLFYATLGRDLKKLLEELSKKISEIPELDPLLNTILGEVSEALGTQYTALLTPNEKKEFVPQRILGLQDPLKLTLPSPNPVSSLWGKDPRPLIRTELEYARSAPSVAKFLKEREIGVLSPLHLKGRLVGILVLGEKTNRDPFTTSEISFLEDLALNLAIGIENAKLYKELQEKIEDLEKFRKFAVGREKRIAELKSQVSELEEKMLKKA